jgi:hypothetical protein
MFRHLELGVAIELFMSETALECDIVLPETSFYEHAEIRNGMWLGPEVILCQPAVAPLGEAKPLYEIVKGIATKMGWGEHFPYQKWEDWGELVMKDIPMSLDELKEEGLLGGAGALQPRARRPAHAVEEGRDPLAGLRRRGLRSVSDLHRAQRPPRRRLPAAAHALEAQHALQHRHAEQSVPDGGVRRELGGDQPGRRAEDTASSTAPTASSSRRRTRSASRRKSSRGSYPAA